MISIMVYQAILKQFLNYLFYAISSRELSFMLFSNYAGLMDTLKQLELTRKALFKSIRSRNNKISASKTRSKRRTPTLAKDKTASCCFLTIYLDSVCWQSSFPLRYIALQGVFHTEGFQGMEHFEGVAYRHEEDMLCIENDECSKISPGLFCK